MDFIHVYPSELPEVECTDLDGAHVVNAPLPECALCQVGVCIQTLDNEEPSVVIHTWVRH